MLIAVEGECLPDNWLDLAKPNILTRMLDYEEGQIEFSILSLVRDPIHSLTEKLAVNVKCLQIVNDCLHSSRRASTREASLSDVVDSDTVLGPDESLNLSEDVIEQAAIPVDQREMFQTWSPEQLLEHEQKLSISQKELRTEIRDEQQSRLADEEYALRRRFDYGPAVRSWLLFLQQKKIIGALI